MLSAFGQKINPDLFQGGFYQNAQPRSLSKAIRYNWDNKVPSGVVLHYTASGNLSGTLNHLQSTGLGYHFLIDREGGIVQTADLFKGTAHCKANHRGLSCNRNYLGIALVSWGLLKQREGNFYAWPNEHSIEVNESFVTYSKAQYWHAASDEQMTSLIMLTRDLVSHFGISSANVIGHHEVDKAKSDPGGSLLVSMDVFRFLMEFYK